MTLPRRGQAVLELAVSLFAIVVVLVGILSFGVLSRAGVDAMVEAQLGALEGAENGAAETFDPVADVLPGPDGRFLTPDDKPERGTTYGARLIASFASPDEAGREAAARHGAFSGAGDALGGLAAGGGGGSPSFGFKHAEASSLALLPPAATPLMGLEEEVEVSEEVWAAMPGGLR